MKALLTLIASLFVTVAAQAADCIPQAEVQEIARTFTQFQKYAGSDYCYDGGQDSHLLAGIAFMRQTKFQDPMDRSSDDLFSGKFAANWWNYFIGRINEFEIDSNCPKGVVAYVFAFGGRTMYACSAALTDQFTAMDLASVFMHEARHIDGYPHITCSRGPRQGLSGACDRNISDTGSYAVTVETYAQLSKYALGINPALKAFARSASVIYADEAFENAVRIARSDRFLVMAKDKRLVSLSPNGSTQVLGMAPELGHVVMRSQHMILFPDNPNSRARFMFARGEGEIASLAGNQAEEYNALSPSDRPSMVDVHIGAQWNARVYKTKVRLDCDPRAQKTEELALSDAPVGMIYPNGYDRSVKSAQLMTESGRIYELGCNGTSAFLQASSMTLDRKYKSLYKVGSLTLGLTADGFVREISGSSSRPYSLGALDGQVHEILPNQVVNFYGEN
ncbi:MAG TPA: hypothetical protein VIH99_11690 [Bdellovibrionota bacterium]|jgi:hypothetical protein